MQGPPPGHGSAEPLWRAIAVFRFASLGYAALLAILNRVYYVRFGWAWAVIAAMTAWTVVTTVAYAHPERRTRALLGADLAITAGLLLPLMRGLLALLLRGLALWTRLRGFARERMELRRFA